MSIFFELHKDIPREGPGLNESTLKAYNMLEDLPQTPHILDVGCGPGMQTIALAKASGGRVVGLDTHEPFLNTLKANALAEGLQEHIEPLSGSMFEMPFVPERFDLIWSEGSIYIMGVEEALKAWKPLLKEGGYLVFSEISWLHNQPDPEVKTFWDNDYPAMTGISGNMKRIEDAGYSPVGCFVLPERGWWQDYYTPLLERVAMLREKYPDDLEENLVLDLTVKEIELYGKYAKDFGYVFYLMRKE